MVKLNKVVPRMEIKRKFSKSEQTIITTVETSVKLKVQQYEELVKRNSVNSMDEETPNLRDSRVDAKNINIVGASVGRMHSNSFDSPLTQNYLPNRQSKDSNYNKINKDPIDLELKLTFDIDGNKTNNIRIKNPTVTIESKDEIKIEENNKHHNHVDKLNNNKSKPSNSIMKSGNFDYHRSKSLHGVKEDRDNIELKLNVSKSSINKLVYTVTKNNDKITKQIPIKSLENKENISINEVKTKRSVETERNSIKERSSRNFEMDKYKEIKYVQSKTPVETHIAKSIKINKSIDSNKINNDISNNIISKELEQLKSKIPISEMKRMSISNKSVDLDNNKYLEKINIESKKRNNYKVNELKNNSDTKKSIVYSDINENHNRKKLKKNSMRVRKKPNKIEKSEQFNNQIEESIKIETNNKDIPDIIETSIGEKSKKKHRIKSPETNKNNKLKIKSPLLSKKDTDRPKKLSISSQTSEKHLNEDNSLPVRRNKEDIRKHRLKAISVIERSKRTENIKESEKIDYISPKSKTLGKEKHFSSDKPKSNYLTFKRTATQLTDKWNKIKTLRKNNNSFTNKTNLESESKNIFGLSLQNLFENCENKIPMFIFNLIHIIEEKGLKTNGIYRESGSAQSIKNIINSINKCTDINYNLNSFIDEDIHTFANVLKNFIREIPEALIPNPFCESMIELQRINADISTIMECLTLIPLYNKAILFIIMAHIEKITKHSKENFMDPYNLGICLAPSLLPEHQVTNFIDFNLQKNLIARIIINYKLILHDEDTKNDIIKLIPNKVSKKYDFIKSEIIDI